MDFGRALATVFAIGSNRKSGDGDVVVDDGAEQIGWTHGIAGIVILIVVQAGLILWSAGQLAPQLLLDATIVAIIALIVPFIVFWLGALLSGTLSRLPAAFLFLGVALAVLQLISALLSNFGMAQSGFIIGLVFAVFFLAARGFLKVGWFPAIIVGLLVVAGFIGAGLLLFVLPSGRSFV